MVAPTELITIQSVVLKAGMLTDEALRTRALKKNTKKRGNSGELSRDRKVKDDNKRSRTGRAFATTASNPIKKEYSILPPPLLVRPPVCPPVLPPCGAEVGQPKLYVIIGGIFYMREDMVTLGRRGDSYMDGPSILLLKSWHTVSTLMKFPTGSTKFTTGSTKHHTAEMGRKGKAGSSQNNIDDKVYWDSGCSRSKDETSDILKKFITEIENLKDYKVKIIRCDNGGEFRNKEMNDFCSQKGIKREFSNARTPQQNGVAKRRNRTLIEAARTMLADAKLPVTFWAEANNTTCYVQNRVIVNKSQNKTPYELFNGRTPAIGFLKPFGCHVMILNTLDNLGKFEEKWDECYFIGYSMSSKAFRVFNKRTRRVEENLHVEFLENKAIEQGAGPNWLFDIDSLTKSMNYVPVDATDQMETLTVESPIPTVSSPVPAACLNDSSEPSSEARLVSKRVANQEETPSLDNILSLTNRFEDILKVSTSSDEIIRVEAD
nr:retrovirus-related Pol polyprotein from transposon TNT 1-94 [Tanacetum cinerariifolium]